MEKTICQNCGAKIDSHVSKCPYCDYINVFGAEKEYFNKLNKTRLELDNVDEEAEQAYRDEFKYRSKSIIKKVAIILGIFLVLALIITVVTRFTFIDTKSDKDFAEEMKWQNENFPKLDELFEAGDLDGFYELMNKYIAEKHDMWGYSHYDVYQCYSDYIDAVSWINDDKSDYHKDADIASFIIFDCMYIIYCKNNPAYEKYSDKDKEYINDLIIKASDLLKNELSLSDEQIADYLNRSIDDSWISYNKCKKLGKEYVS